MIADVTHGQPDAPANAGSASACALGVIGPAWLRFSFAEVSMNRAVKYLGISVGLAFVSAITFVVVMTLTLPDTDLAHGQKPFEDPLVLPVMAVVAAASGVIGWPLFLVFGWRVAPKKVAITTGALVLGWIALATPFDPAYGWPGSYVVCILALVFCAFMFRQRRNGEPGAAPNGGPATQLGNSGVTEGPPSVS